MAGDKDMRRSPEGSDNNLSTMPGVSTENRPKPVNRITPTRDAYWFAHGGIEESPPLNRSTSRHADAKDAQLQKEREERVRAFQEQKEEERVKRMKELEESFHLARKYREQQEEERRRKIEEAKLRENERRQQVEERKRQIWEAEQERKSAILRRNLEREARIEARRNAQRNSGSFAFGSSTPRTFDLDLAALGRSSAVGCPLMSAVSNRRYEDSFGSKRATSACSLDRKSEYLDLSTDSEGCENDKQEMRSSSVEPDVPHMSIAKKIAIEHMKSERTKACLTMWDLSTHSSTGKSSSYSDSPSSRWLVGPGALVGEDCMSWSMISLSSASRGRRRTDLTPTVPSRERSITPHTTPRGKPGSHAISMTRLDQLAQPRRRYYNVSTDNSSVTSTATTSPSGPRAVSPSISKSMCNLTNAAAYQPFRKLTRTPAKGGSSMSKSMMQLPNASQANQRPLNVTNNAGSLTTKLRPAQSMSHLAIAPRLTRAARLRASALANSYHEDHTKSMVNLHRNETHVAARLSAKDTSRSPSRPQSAMSGKSETSMSSSQASGVVLRPKPAPRKPRPVSIAGTIVDRPVWNSSIGSDRQSRSQEQNATVPKTARARSREPENKPKSASVSKKPVPPPKSAQVLAKARSHPVPTKDNLRKVKAPGTDEKTSSDNSGFSDTQPASEPASADGETGESPAPVAAKTQAVSDSAPSVAPAATATTVAEAQPVEPDESHETPAVQKAKDENAGEIAQAGAAGEQSVTKPRITSEEEAKAALAEKRRLAREQAEREAELERQRLEKLRLEEEERRRQEELEQKRQEEEQIRLAELHRKMEEEKLRKAIEEQEQREREEKARMEEEARLKAEKEEQERKAREEAMRQRLELEEKLRKEEQERAERKRRVEQIMSRTRIRGSQSADALSASKPTESPAASASPVEVRKASDTNVISSAQNILSEAGQQVTVNSLAKSTVVTTTTTVTSLVQDGSQSQTKKTAEQLDLDFLVNSTVKNGLGSDNVEHSKTSSYSNDLICVPNRTTDNSSAAAAQTNGYSSHEDSCSTSSPEERSEKSDSSEGMTSMQPTHVVANIKKDVQVESSSQLIDISTDETTTNSHNNNFMINVDIMNSNVNSDPFHTLDDNLLKKQENTITDLLS